MSHGLCTLAASISASTDSLNTLVTSNNTMTALTAFYNSPASSTTSNKEKNMISWSRNENSEPKVTIDKIDYNGTDLCDTSPMDKMTWSGREKDGSR